MFSCSFVTNTCAGIIIVGVKCKFFVLDKDLGQSNKAV